MLRLWKRSYSTFLPDFEPHSVLKIVSASKSAPKQSSTKKKKNEANPETIDKPAKNDNQTNVNDMGIQMISKNLFQQIFKNSSSIAFEQNQIDT